MVRRFLLRLLNAFRPYRAEAALAREVAAHLALLEDDFRRRGLSPEDGRLRLVLCLVGAAGTPTRSMTSAAAWRRAG